MCTVTVIPWRGRVRLAANRDEQRSRPEALPPEVRSFGRRRAVLPIDPIGGGTWVAVNNAGLVLTLLNVTRTGNSGVPQPVRSRGSIIPALLSCDTLSQAIECARNLDTGAYAPFRLVLVDADNLAELCSHGNEIQLLQNIPLTGPHLFTSSGLGDELVDAPRRQLFTQEFRPATDWLTAQDAFHRHSWSDRPELSVCMRRADARTVSKTTVVLGPENVTLAYHPDAPDQPARLFNLDLCQGGG